MLIVHDVPITEEHRRRLGLLGGRVGVTPVSEFGPAAGELLGRVEVIYTAAADFDPAQTPRLRLVQTNSASLNLIAGKPILRTAIPIANVRGAYTPAVAECAMGLLLSLVRRIHLGVRYQIQNTWPADAVIETAFRGGELYGQTMGLVGYGSIGRHIARIGTAFGMEILACDRSGKVGSESSYSQPNTGDPDGILPRAWFEPARVNEMLGRCDVVILTLPGVPSTRHRIGRAELAAMRKHAYLINVGRGSILDESALVEALRAGRLAGAGLDVFEQEPLPADSPLWRFENVVMTPHVGSWTDQQVAHANDVLVENVRRLLHGLPILNRIDKQLLF